MSHRLLRVVALIAALVAVDLQAQTPAQPVTVAFLYSDGNLPGTLKAFKSILQERPDLKGKIELRFLTESVFDDTKPAQITSAKVLMLDMMNQQMLDRFNAKYRIDVIQQVRRSGQVLAVGEGLLPKERYTSQGAILDDTARAFWAHSGFKNQVGLLKLALTRAGVKGLVIPAPEPSLDFGYYYPDGRDGRVLAPDRFAAWARANGKQKPGAPRIASRLLQVVLLLGRDRAHRRGHRRDRTPRRMARAVLRLSTSWPLLATGRREGRAARACGAVAALPVRGAGGVGADGEGEHPRRQPDQPLRRSEQEWRASSRPLVLRGDISGRCPGTGRPGGMT
jgi:hypothetical protein